MRPAPTISHSFTHFRLHIQPLLCTATMQAKLAEPGLRWVGMDALATTALPAPVRRLLNETL
jgi:A/G-specific adenine glycosylase